MPRKKNVTQQERDEIVKVYLSGKKISEFANDFGFNPEEHGSILKILKKAGVKVRPLAGMAKKHSMNHNFFEKIDTERKAYWLGLLYADGYNGDPNHGIVLQLVESEKYVLEQLLLDLEATNTLRFVKANPKYKNAKNSWNLNVFSLKMQEDLRNLGCTKKKSLTLKFPTEEQVPKHLLPHFIRGYFDGDGTVCNHLNKGKPRTFVAFISTYDFLYGLREFFNKEYGFSMTKLKIDKRMKQTITRCLCYYDPKQITKFKEVLYKDSTICFKRKFDKFE